MMTVTLAGNTTNSLTGATELVLPVLGVRPYFADESDVEPDNGGTMRAVRARRLVYDLTPKPFAVVPDGVKQDSRTYFDLVEVLYMRHVWIVDFSAELRRMMDDDYGLVASDIIELPAKVVLSSLGEFGPDFETGQNRIDSIQLASEGWW